VQSDIKITIVMPLRQIATEVQILIMTEQETVLSLENQTPVLENPSIVLLCVYFVVKEYVSS
jgi:hypothetical protein